MRLRNFSVILAMISSVSATSGDVEVYQVLDFSTSSARVLPSAPTRGSDEEVHRVSPTVYTATATKGGEYVRASDDSLNLSTLSRSTSPSKILVLDLKPKETTYTPSPLLGAVGDATIQPFARTRIDVPSLTDASNYTITVPDLSNLFVLASTSGGGAPQRAPGYPQLHESVFWPGIGTADSPLYFPPPYMGFFPMLPPGAVAPLFWGPCPYCHGFSSVFSWPSFWSGF